MREDSADDESLASTPTALPPRKRLPVKDPADRVWGGQKNIKHLMFHRVKKGDARHREGVEFVQHRNKERKPVSCIRLAVWHFAKLRVSANITRRKVTEQACKHFI
jgi:hypothetical protein